MTIETLNIWEDSIPGIGDASMLGSRAELGAEAEPKGKCNV